MPDLPKKELDKLFRRGADHYDIDFNPAAWEQMEGLLDRDRRRRAIWWWLAALAGSLLVFAIIFSLNTKNTSSVIEEANKRPIAEGGSHEGSNSSTANRDLKQLEAIIAGEEIQVDANQGDLPNTTFETQLLQQGGKVHEIKPKGKRPVPLAEKPALEKGETGTKTTLALHPDDGETSEGSPIGDEPGSLSRQASGLLNFLPVLSTKFLTYHEPESPDLAFSDRYLLGSQALPGHFTSTLPKALFLKGTLSSEFTSIGMGDFSGPGVKLGLELEYLFSSRSGFGIGALISKARYTAGNGEYIPPKGFWTRKIAPIETSGKMTILEIPVMLSYYLKDYNTSGWFAKIGMSNFLLLRERYRYFYDLSDPDLIRKWGTDNENQTWLGILDLSVGYSKHFSPAVALEIAPYAQIPVSGVGHGQVKMYTFGLSFSMKYHLKKK